jgi:hypothetical protein
MVRALMLVIGFCFPSFAQSQTCSIPENQKIVHIPQMHWGEAAIGNPGFAEMVAKSQFEVARTLLAYPDRKVFMESRYSDSNSVELRERQKATAEAKRLFPNGVPKNYSEMTPDQKRFISETTAVDTLLLLGEIKVVHKTYASKGQALRFDKSLKDVLTTLKAGELPDSNQLNQIYKDREKAAVREVDQWLRSNRGQKVFIVYGAAHDFDSFYSDNFARAACPNSEMPKKWSLTLDSLKRSPASTN